MLKKYLSVIQQVYQLSVMILQEENHSVQGTIAIQQKTRQQQDIGLVINGVQTHQSITNSKDRVSYI